MSYESTERRPDDDRLDEEEHLDTQVEEGATAGQVGAVDGAAGAGSAGAVSKKGGPASGGFLTPEL